MAWKAQTKRHRTGIRLAELPVVAVPALAASHSEAMRRAQRLCGYSAVRPVCFDDPIQR